MKVLLYPTPEQIDENNGIGRVIHAQYKYLVHMGVQFVSDENQADVVALHTQQYGFKRVDVLHLHGLYWTGEPGSGKYDRWTTRANADILKAARRARTITVPSEWVAAPFKRDMRIVPEVIPHGIDISQWSPLTDSERQKTPAYLLWGKNRSGDVCNPVWPLRVAEKSIPVISTFTVDGQTIPENLKVVGAQPHDQMRRLIRHASALLVTTKETFGIQILEALACGVPVLAFNFGSQAQIIRHGVDGYLARPYDLNDLVQGWAYIRDNWSRLSEAARSRATEYTWDKAMQKYFDLYQHLAHNPEPPLQTTIVIPCHNYAAYVDKAIESALSQTVPTKVIVVDDGSTDNSVEVIRRYENQITFLPLSENKGVAFARNLGIEKADTPLIVCLDADDELDSRYVETLQPAFADRGLGIAYTGLMINGRLHEWPPDFSWEAMAKLSNPPANVIPSAAMFRRELWKRAGGFLQSVAPGEDTYLWLTGLALGFTARKVTEEGLFRYRVHPDSASRTKTYIPFGWIPWLVDHQYPMAAPAEEVPLVRSYSEPLVSVIIPVTKKHEEAARHAIQSVVWQSFRNWQLTLITDGFSSKALKELFPFAQVFQTDKPVGAGAARNIGIRYAQKSNIPFVLFLDADDWLLPNALDGMIRAYTGPYVYTDWVAYKDGVEELKPSAAYDPQRALEIGLHPITVLMATEQAAGILFDETLPFLEDFDFFAHAAVLGYHGVRLPGGLVTVNVTSGVRTAQNSKRRRTLADEISSRYRGKEMASCCGGVDKALEQLRRYNEDTATIATAPPKDGKVRMRFVGEERGSVTYGGPGITKSGKRYVGGNNVFDRYVDAEPEDVVWLEGTGKWKRV